MLLASTWLVRLDQTLSSYSILAALVAWGYTASEVEQLLTAPDENDTDEQDDEDEDDEPAAVTAD